MKNNSGISLIELVIVMIIMILIVSFAVFNGSPTVEKSQATELYAEMTSMKNAVAGIIARMELEDANETWLQQNVHYDASGENGFYIIYGQGNSHYDGSNVRKELNMKDIKRDYLVNYETGEVMLREPMEVLGSSVRSYESVRALVESNKI